MLSALCLLLAVTAGSCAQDELLDVPTEPGSSAASSGSRISLKFKINADNSGSLTRSGLGQWEDESSNQAERALDPQDIRVLILNADGNLIKTVKPTTLSYEQGVKDENLGIYGDGYYTVQVFFEDDYFDNFFDTYGDNEPLDFQVMIFANINSIGGNYTVDSFSPGALNANLAETFTMAPDWYPSETHGIPMFGLKQNIRANKKQLTSPNGYNVEGDIDMLRALCKVEVQDQIPGIVNASDNLKYPRVSGVEMISWRNKGNLRPSINNYNTGVTVANIPFLNLSPVTTPLQAKIKTDNSDFNNDGKAEEVYRIYCPEAKLSEVTMRVYVQMEPNQEKPDCYEVNLGKYADGNDNPNRKFGDDLVRNHIYRFAVTSVSAQADLTLTVSEWRNAQYDYTLDNIIQMAESDCLKWDTEGNSDFSVSSTTYNGTDQQMLSMLNATTNYVTGTFTIPTPVGATWRAYLIPGENGVDAFEFVDVDNTGKVVEGSARSYVEGQTGTKATIHLRGKGAADAYRHYAELVVVVRQPDGSVLYAPIVDGKRNRYIIYREDKL